MVMPNWTPKEVGNDFALSPILSPLGPFRRQTLVVSGLNNHYAGPLGDGGGDHARAGGAFLTTAHPRKVGDIHVGVSADQVAAQAVGGQTRLPSLELGLDDNRTVGHCDSGYSCAYTNSISWRTPTTPQPPVTNPRLVFERLFGNIDTSLDAETRARRARYRASILDATLGETATLVGDLGHADRRKVDEYLTSIREVERGIQQTERQAVAVPAGVDRPAGTPVEFADHARLMFDLLALAFQADLTRVATFMIGREGSVRTYEQIGVPEPHHPLSHHRNQAPALERLTRINAYHVELFTHFLRKLSETPDGDGSLLDRSMILYGSGLSDSNRHLHNALPIAVVGGGNGTLQGGRHVRFDAKTPLANLFLALLHRINVRPERFGDSTGPLEI
jgi:hypothetical protein